MAKGNKQNYEKVQAELAKRELARRHYADYLAYVYGKEWKRTRFSEFVAAKVQAFIEADTGNAYDILILESPPQHGKELADSTMVPTPDGFKRHGDLKPGDYVFGPAGNPVKVLAEIPQDEPASLMVTFVDGAQVKAHPNHEWVVSDRRQRHKVHNVETRVMMEKGLCPGVRGRGCHFVYAVDANVCVEYPEAEQHMDPYVFGLWLGDGTTVAANITHHPADTAPIEKCVERGYDVSAEHIHKTTGCVRSYFYRGRMAHELKEMGLGYVGCREKYIPDNYKVASKQQRLELLAGMIDSDGYVYQKNGRITISNINKRLIDDFAEVVRSLGWRATISAAPPITSSSGIVGKHTVYQLTFNPDCEIPTVLPRKKVRSVHPMRRRRAIVSIEPCEPEHGKCITVEGGVYLVTDHFIPTHNSRTVSEALPSWYLGKYPTKRVIEVSYNDDTAERFLRMNKDKVKNCGKQLFGVEVGKVDRSDHFELSAGGTILSRGIKAGITGNPADLMIIDDPIKNRQEADSETTRNLIWGEWLNSMKSRLSAGAKVILIMTPWHEDDMAARMAQMEDTATLIRLPVEAQEDDPLGRSPGEPLCPEIGKDAAWLEQFKKSYLSDAQGGARAWSALYMCNPVIEGGNMVQRSWWRYYDTKEITSFGTECISVDAAFKDGDDNDYVAIQVWGKLSGNYYLRFRCKAHMNFTATVEKIRQVRACYPKVTYVYIEDKANGSAIIQVLQRYMPGVVGVNPLGGKVARVNAVSPAIETGHVFLPKDDPGIEEYIKEWSEFPAGKHDDEVDATSQALSKLMYAYDVAVEPERSQEEQYYDAAEDAFLSEQCYDPYGMSMGSYLW